MPTSTDELLSQLLEGIERELPRAVALRHRLHADPELAHGEQRTAAAIAAELPVACQRAAGTGLIAIVGDGADPGGGRPGDPSAPGVDADRGGTPPAPVAVRAELDGLPVRERTGAAFAASGEVMHACGHDVHMAALVAFARAAYELRDELPAPLAAVFQPSEEAYPSGARQLADGELAALEPAAVVAAHIHPELPWQAVALDAGTVNASCDIVHVVVEGKPAHGAYPHRGRDPILAIAELVVALHAQAGRRIDPLHPASLTIGVLEGGSAENVIPERASARGALRAYRPQDRMELRALVERVAHGVAAASGCSATVELAAGEPALENDPRIVARARGLSGRAGLALAPAFRSCGSDDFAFFGALAPLAMAFVGLDGAPGFDSRPLHHPELLVPDAAVAAVARAQAVLYVSAAAPG
ncbi:MAG TPA: M20 family metallopeptidase [Solirubrobacteraceae bacterium]|jgi:amidohydrolase|nr:M20 family metallopeptidase [Solirubrobacteraceae bacterium]